MLQEDATCSPLQLSRITKHVKSTDSLQRLYEIIWFETYFYIDLLKGQTLTDNIGDMRLNNLHI